MLNTNDAVGLCEERAEEGMQPGLDDLDATVKTEPPDICLQ